MASTGPARLITVILVVGRDRSDRGWVPGCGEAGAEHGDLYVLIRNFYRQLAAVDGSIAAQSVSESVLRAHSQTEVPTHTKGSITFHKSHCRRTRKLRDRIGLHSGLSGKKQKGGNFAALFFVRWFGCNV